MRYLLGLVVLVFVAFSAFGLGWNSGQDAERRMHAAESVSERPVTNAGDPVVSSAQKTPPGMIPEPEVYYSPRGGCTQAICDEIGKARQSILIQAYGFTSEPIGGALVAALKRGVKVGASLDAKSNRDEGRTIADMIAAAGAEVRLDAKHAISHSKVMIIDGATVITGSFNFTNAAEHSNLENLLVIRSAELAERYRENFESHWDHADPYMPEVVVPVSSPSPFKTTHRTR